MIFHGNVVVRRGKRYWAGVIDDKSFTVDKPIDNIDEFIKSGPKLIDLFDYARFIGSNLTQKEIIDIRRKIGYSDIWIIDDESPEPNSAGISETAWKKWYFKFIHPMCQKCVRKCKQSSRVGVFCNKFEEKK